MTLGAGSASTWAQLHQALEPLALEGAALHDVLALREAREELGRVELVEGGLVALEGDLGDALPAHRALRPQVDELLALGRQDAEAVPGVAVDLAVDAEVAVAVVQLQEELGLREGAFGVLVGTRRRDEQGEGGEGRHDGSVLHVDSPACAGCRRGPHALCERSGGRPTPPEYGRSAGESIRKVS